MHVKLFRSSMLYWSQYIGQPLKRIKRGVLEELTNGESRAFCQLSCDLGILDIPHFTHQPRKSRVPDSRLTLVSWLPVAAQNSEKIPPRASPPESEYQVRAKYGYYRRGDGCSTSCVHVSCLVLK